MSYLRPFRGSLFEVQTRVRRLRSSDRQLVKQVRHRSRQLTSFSSHQFSNATEQFRQRMMTSSSLLRQNTVIESFSLTNEAIRRALGKALYDVQILAGIVLATGAIAEMQTGEGKTIACALPASLHAWSGQGVHIATTNAYLANRDFSELKPAFETLGLTCGLIEPGQDSVAKKDAYQCDVTYGTGFEFGFDFLRDQLAMRTQPAFSLGTKLLGKLRGLNLGPYQCVQRELNFAIIDEADSVLIDEATTPLILSGHSNGKAPKTKLYLHAKATADRLVDGIDYETCQIRQSIRLNDSCWQNIHSDLPSDVQELLDRPWSQYVEQSLRAATFLNRDVDYVVKNEKIVFVDQNTGRLFEDRKWQDGLHQSIEMREGLEVSEEREVEAKITRQRFYEFYKKKCGMTGTATGNEIELFEFYDLPVVRIPRNNPIQLATFPCRFFVNQTSKYDAIASEVEQIHNGGRPVLIGTRTIAQSCQLSKLLHKKGIEHQILNGVQDSDESEIISRAGRCNGVTIATNMAGRGTDIKLDTPSLEAGGLHVVAVEHHNSIRVDRQLVGRSARQTDPGSCRFFVSGEDQLIEVYDPKLASLIRQYSDDDLECRQDLTQQIRLLQIRVESLNFAARQKMVVHDAWLETVQKSVARIA